MDTDDELDIAMVVTGLVKCNHSLLLRKITKKFFIHIWKRRDIGRVAGAYGRVETVTVIRDLIQQFTLPTMTHDVINSNIRLAESCIVKAAIKHHKDEVLNYMLQTGYTNYDSILCEAVSRG